MKPDLIAKTWESLFRFPDKTKRTNEFFENRGFSRIYDPSDLVGKVFATSYKTPNYDFFTFIVKDMKKCEFGWNVFSEEDITYFGNLKRDKRTFDEDLSYTVNLGLELFIPNYLFNFGMIFAGEDDFIFDDD